MTLFRGDNFKVFMDIIDSSEHMTNGGINDAKYFAKEFVSVMLEIDPNWILFDMDEFDGAVNMQKVDDIIVVRIPCAIIIHRV